MSSIKTPILFSEDDIYIRYMGFGIREIKKILIIGLPGSGKSSLAENLCNTSNDIEHVNLDRIKNNKYYTDEELEKNDPSIYYWLTHEFGQPRETFSDLPKDIQKKELKRCFYWLLYNQEQTVMAIEGDMHNFFTIGNTIIARDYSIIIKRTSVLKSIYRFATREWNAGYNLSKFTILKYILKHICKYPRFKRELDNTVKYIASHMQLDVLNVPEDEE